MPIGPGKEPQRRHECGMMRWPPMRDSHAVRAAGLESTRHRVGLLREKAGGEHSPPTTQQLQRRHERARQRRRVGRARRADERAPAGDVSPGAVVASPTEERAVGEGAEHDGVTMAGPGGEKRPRESGGTPPRQRLLGRLEQR